MSDLEDRLDDLVSEIGLVGDRLSKVLGEILSREPAPPEIKIDTPQPLVQVEAPVVEVKPEVIVSVPEQTPPVIHVESPAQEPRKACAYVVEVVERGRDGIRRLTITPQNP